MDVTGIKAALLSWVNDQLEVIDYGHGALVYVPLHYTDDDAITLLVEPHGASGVRVTDRGMTRCAFARATSSSTPPDPHLWEQSLIAAAVRSRRGRRRARHHR